MRKIIDIENIAAELGEDEQTAKRCIEHYFRSVYEEMESSEQLIRVPYFGSLNLIVKDGKKLSNRVRPNSIRREEQTCCESST